MSAAIGAAPGPARASSKARVSSLPARVVVAPVPSFSALPFVNSLGSVPHELTNYPLAGALLPTAAGPAELPVARPMPRGVAAVAKTAVPASAFSSLQRGVAGLDHARGHEQSALGQIFGEPLRREESALAGPYGSFGPAEPPQAPVPPAPRPGSRGVVVGAGLAVGGILAASPWLYAEPWLAGALGTAALSVIGFPQILKNFRERAAATKDIAFGWPVLWTAAASLLTGVAIANGSSVWYLIGNLGGVLSAAILLAQVNAWSGTPKRRLVTIAAALASAAGAAAAALAGGAVASAAFFVAMALLLVVNWPQIRGAYELYQAEVRAPTGMSPLTPLLVLTGGLLHLIAALALKDAFWAINSAIAMTTVAIFLSQLFFPAAANRALGPAIRFLIAAQSRVAGLFGRQRRKRPV